jgi:serine protease Do
MLRENKLKIWILALAAGAAAGFLLATRLNLLPLTNAEYETVKPEPLNVQALESSFVRVAREVGAAVVSISTERSQRVGGPRTYFRFFGDDDFGSYFDDFFRDFFGEIPGREYTQRGLGSGFIIDEAGYILTNQHVVQNADKITVTLPDGRRFEAELKGSDQRSDLAVIKIEAQDLPAVTLGDSDNIQIGQWAMAIGNPYGFAVGSAEPTVTAGIISALNRSLPQSSQRRSYIDLIQTDAAINPGNSGGPLVNIRGEVIGINVAIFSPSGGNVGIGFAIPINSAKGILSRLIAGKRVLYGWLGVSIQDLNEELADYFGITNQQGAVVIKVLKMSPAEKAGFKEGDVIKRFAGKEVEDVRSLVKEVGRTEVGKTVNVEIIRDKRPLTLRVKVAERPEELEEAAEVSQKAWRGMEVSELTSDLARRYRIEEQQALVITHVEPGTPASLAGLIPGDVIISINRRRVRNMQEYESLIKKLKGNALMRTERGFVILKPE